MITQQELIDAARQWVGVKYMHQGRTRFGIDCIGLIIEVGKEVGILPQEFDQVNYSRLPTSKSQLLSEIAARCEQTKTPEPASLLVIQWTREPYHVAICTGTTLIHSSATVGRVVEHGYRPPWPALTLSSWRLPGVIYV